MIALHKRKEFCTSDALVQNYNICPVLHATGTSYLECHANDSMERKKETTKLAHKNELLTEYHFCVNPLPKDPQVGPLPSQPPEAARGHAAHDGQRGRLLRPPHALHFHIQVSCSNRSHMKRQVS